MGYRNYIGKISKKEYNKIKKLNKEELFKKYNEDVEDGYVSCTELGAELHEFGKYVDFDPPKDSIKKFFFNKDLENYYNSDGELKIVTKEFLSYIIGHYKDKVKRFYSEYATPFIHGELMNNVKREYNSKYDEEYRFDFTKISDEEQTALYKIINHIRDYDIEWECKSLLPYNLEGDSLSSSWKFEYAIFELVYIYKTFNWKKDILYYYGY